MSIFKYDDEHTRVLLKRDIPESGYDEEKIHVMVQEFNDDIELGTTQAIEQSIHIIIALCREMDLPEEFIINKLTNNFPLSIAHARQYINKFTE